MEIEPSSPADTTMWDEGIDLINLRNNDRTEAEADAITIHNDRESQLLRLPAELRNRVYEYALTDGAYRHVRHFVRAEWTSYYIFQPRPTGLNVSMVCRKVSHEAALLPFVLNTFQCREICDVGALSCCLTLAQRNAVRSLSFHAHLSKDYGVSGLTSSVFPAAASGFHGMFPNIQHVRVFVEHSEPGSWCLVYRQEFAEPNRELLKEWLHHEAPPDFEVVWDECPYFD